MTGAERGFLLLTSHLGNPMRHPLSVAQFRVLAERMQAASRNPEDRELNPEDLKALGYGTEMAERVVRLLSEEELLDHYLQKARKLECVPVTRVSEGYPLVVRKRLGLDSPGCLWARGEVELLKEPTVSLVGSRELRKENWRFAAEVGRQAALQGYVLVSGNARGADRAAQDSCLQHGGKVISVVADELWKHPKRENVLYLSEDGYEEAFSAQRALSRNRVIHALGLKTFVAQASLKTGGTWDGTVKNLRFGWSPVFCYDDGSEVMQLLFQMGATPVHMDDLNSIYELSQNQSNLFDR